MLSLCHKLYHRLLVLFQRRWPLSNSNKTW